MNQRSIIHRLVFIAASFFATTHLFTATARAAESNKLTPLRLAYSAITVNQV